MIVSHLISWYFREKVLDYADTYLLICNENIFSILSSKACLILDFYFHMFQENIHLQQNDPVAVSYSRLLWEAIQYSEAIVITSHHFSNFTQISPSEPKH